jgi:LPXTG-site transpeptidase (sortase) family protein
MAIKKEGLILFKFFLLFFILFFVIINWNKISWIFNYKALYLTFSNWLSKEKTKNPLISFPNPTLAPSTTFSFSEKENSIEIPSIEISAPIFLVKSTDEKKILENLDRGVVMFEDYALPSKEGATVILGHSAMHDWPKSNPAWVFTYLRDVKEGDEIIINFEHRKYIYYVTKKFILKEGEDLPKVENGNILFLVTCWPPGRLSFKQKLVVEAKLKNN